MPSASFTVDATAAAAAFGTGGLETSGTTATTATLSYNAIDDSYTLAAAGQTARFTPADLVSSTLGTLSFSTTVGNITQRLVIERGFTSDFFFKRSYVGAGRWVITDTTDPDEDYLTSSFVYGLPSDAAAVPTSGRATFGFNLLGTRATVFEGDLLGVSGFGSSVVDFAAGTLEFDSTFISSSISNGTTSLSSLFGTLEGDATLGSARNNFNGTFTARFNNSTENYLGTIEGGFYGPATEEIGALLTGSIGDGPFIDVALVGSRFDTVAPGDTLAARTGRTGTQGIILTDVLPTGSTGANLSYTASIIYDAATDKYEVVAPFDTRTPGRDAFSFGPANRAAIRDAGDLRFYVLGNAADELEIAVFDGTANGVTLSYTSFIQVLNTERDSGGAITGQRLEYFTFGTQTPRHQIPLAGTAHYTGAAIGQARETNGLVLFPIGGTSEFTVAFDSQTLTAILALTLSDGSAIGTYNFAGNFNANFGGFNALRNDGGSGNMLGLFYGDRAQEIGAGFTVADNSVNRVYDGVAVARQDPAP